MIEITGALGEIRTPDPQIRSLVLYPAELRARATFFTGKPVGHQMRGRPAHLRGSARRPHVAAVLAVLAQSQPLARSCAWICAICARSPDENGMSPSF